MIYVYLYMHVLQVIRFAAPPHDYFYGSAEHYVLVYWEEEKSTSVVLRRAVVVPPASQLIIRNVCQVKVARKTCSGHIVGIVKFPS